MSDLSPKDIGMTLEEIDEKQEAAYQESVSRCAELMKAIDSCEKGSTSSITPVSMIGILIIAAARTAQSLRTGITKQMDEMASGEARPSFLLAAMDTRRALVMLEDELIELFRKRLPECLGGGGTLGSYASAKAIGDAIRQGGWSEDDEEEASDDAEK